jgi:hypothetical protein
MRYRLATDPAGFITQAPNVIGGSPLNSALTTVVGATIAGGGGYDTSIVSMSISNNRVLAHFGTVGGGRGNTASGFAATVAGGQRNTASGDIATVSGGDINTASGSAATLSGGDDNIASGDYSAVGGGDLNIGSGKSSTVPGGAANLASGDYSFAAGRHAKADDQGSFVWADSTGFDFHSTLADGFFVRCVGGVRFVTGIDLTGVQTDRDAKKNIEPVDYQAVLDKLAQVPVSRWNYKWEQDGAVPNLGPMAQDFKAAFYPGRDDKSISTLEFDGVELAAIQGLNRKMEEQKTELQRKESRISALEKELSELKHAVTKLLDKKD